MFHAVVYLHGVYVICIDVLKLDTNSSFFRYGASIFWDVIKQSPVFSHIPHNPQCSILYPSRNDPPSQWDPV